MSHTEFVIDIFNNVLYTIQSTDKMRTAILVLALKTFKINDWGKHIKASLIGHRKEISMIRISTALA